MKKILIKFVKKANLFCKTTFENGTQKQEWFFDKELKIKV